MKKVLVFIIIFIGVAAGYLYYDWNVKTKRLAAEPSKTVYSWTDENGVAAMNTPEMIEALSHWKTILTEGLIPMDISSVFHMRCMYY